MLRKKFTPFPVLTTERLTLRQLIITDEQEIFTLRTDAEINRYLDRPISKSLEDARTFINKVNENIAKNAALYWAVTVGDSNRLVGTVCLFGFSDEDCRCEIGYELLTGFQRQGIMAEAITKVIDYAFNSIKVDQIEAFTHKDNLASINLLQKNLFKDAGPAVKEGPDLIRFVLKNSMDSISGTNANTAAAS